MQGSAWAAAVDGHGGVSPCAVTDASSPASATVRSSVATATPKVPTAVNVSVLRITRPGVLGMENKDTGDVNGDIFFAVFEVLLEGNYGSGFLPYLSNGSALYSQAQIWHNPLHGPYAMQVGHCFKAFPFARLILSHAKPSVCNPMSLIPFAFSCDGTASCIALPIARSVSYYHALASSTLYSPPFNRIIFLGYTSRTYILSSTQC